MSGPYVDPAWRDRVKPGDQVWAWWDSGAMGAEQMVRTVVRVNRKTLTVDMNGQHKRVPFEAFEGIYEEATV